MVRILSVFATSEAVGMSLATDKTTRVLPVATLPMVGWLGEIPRLVATCEFFCLGISQSSTL